MLAETVKYSEAIPLRRLLEHFRPVDSKIVPPTSLFLRSLLGGAVLILSTNALCARVALRISILKIYSSGVTLSIVVHSSPTY